MTAKEYLGQAYRIDQRINSKMEQIASLNLLAQKATTVFSDMPGNSTRNIHRMEDVIIKIVDMESEINADIDSLQGLFTAFPISNIRHCLNCGICVSKHGSRLLCRWVMALIISTKCTTRRCVK